MSYELRKYELRPDPGLAGIFDWLTDLSAPGDAVINAWSAEVRARGNSVVRMPTGAQVGKLAERRNYPTGTYTIQLAPVNVLQADAANIAAGKTAATTDAFFDSVQPGQILSDVGKLAREGVSAVTGIPTWAIPVLLIGGGAYLLISVTKAFLPGGR